jgi:hypothetical protein
MHSRAALMPIGGTSTRSCDASTAISAITAVAASVIEIGVGRELQIISAYDGALLGSLPPTLQSCTRALVSVLQAAVRMRGVIDTCNTTDYDALPPIIVLGTGAGINESFRVRGHATTATPFTTAKRLAALGFIVVLEWEFNMSKVSL